MTRLSSFNLESICTCEFFKKLTRVKYFQIELETVDSNQSQTTKKIADAKRVFFLQAIIVS